MDALRRVHRSLRPAGQLLSSQPLPKDHRQVDVRLRDEIVDTGRLYREPFFVADIRAAGRGLASLVSEGLFRRRQEREFDFVELYGSVESWKSCLSYSRVGSLRADPQRIERAIELMPTGEGEIIVTERAIAIRLERSDHHP